MRQPVRRRRPRVAATAALLLTCCTPCVALHLPTRRPARTIARAAAAAVLDEKPSVAVVEVPEALDAVDVIAQTFSGKMFVSLRVPGGASDADLLADRHCADKENPPFPTDPATDRE